jgi:hypothetical protein
MRDTVHKIFPRELSPTRMLEKWSSDQAKKAKKKSEVISHMSDDSAAALEAARLSLSKIAGAGTNETSAPMLNFQNPQPLTLAPPPVAAPTPVYLYAGAAAVAALALFVLVKKR